jgi:hypothetical protein
MKRETEIEGMSGKSPSGPKPLAPLKPKIKITVAPKRAAVPQSVTDAALTVLPDPSLPKPEDASVATTGARYEGLQVRSGMFSRAVGAAAAGLPAPGKRIGEEKPRRGLNIARPLFEGPENEEEEEEAAAAFRAAEEAPKPPPMVRAPTQQVPLLRPALPQAKPQIAALPSVAKEFMGMNTKPMKKSYAESAVKRRFTEEIAKTLVELDNQLQEMELTLSLVDKTGFTKQEEPVNGKSKYVFDDNQHFADPLTDVSLSKLDDLFESLQIRRNSFLVNESSMDKEFGLLFKYLAYAPKYIKDKPKIQERERKLAQKEMLTERIADTLLLLEQTLSEIHTSGIGIADMTVTIPTEEGKPYIYEFEDGNTFLPVDKTAESRRLAEQRLEELGPLLPGGSKITLTKIVGFGPYDEEGTALNNDLSELYKLFDVAREYKGKAEVAQAKAAEMAAAEEARVAKTLEGTPYEALAGPIESEMSKSPYEITTDSDYRPLKHETKDRREVVLPKQKGFIPQTRRAFGYFIFDKYRRYMLKALEKLDPNACKILGDSSQVTQIYEYQKFVRDYISFMTPYRGVLVYHGLGSGKTCTAIAASEALLSSGGKQRIIVMTPFSLRKNFIQQITFCGFRHFRLLNFWTSYEYKKSDGKNALWLFATSVLQIPESYLLARRGRALRIWIPDLNKPQSEENYSKLSSTEQAEIRQQIYETLVYDPDKGKNGLIWFLNYNGIPASKLLRIACDRTTNAFDNSVIVIDEIHNLVRLMQGVIDPYLKKVTTTEVEAERKGGDARYKDPDRITSERWFPKYCNTTMSYKRGYLFYRLLLQAKNSKIVGLSGTPLINFPEELGILANILHGYNFVYKTTTPKVVQPGGNQRIVDEFKKMAEGNDPANFCPHLDFYDVVIQDRAPAQIEFTFTFLPDGYRKVQGQLGVERIPFSETLLSTEEKLQSAMACIDKVIKSVSPAAALSPVKEKAEPLLPVLGEPSIPDAPANLDDSFKGRFIAPDGVSLTNETVLFKRLSGLISYYKGSRKDLMPEVVEDTVVRVPMSLDQQKKYVIIRLAEIKVEQKKEEKRRRGAVEAVAVRGDDAEVQKLASSQNYRMASRQACNFVFPDGFTRPRPVSAEDARMEGEFGGDINEMIGDDQAVEPSALVGAPEEEAAAAREDRAAADVARAEEEAISLQQEKQEIEALQRAMTEAGKSAAEIAEAVRAIKERYQMERIGEIVAAEDVPEDTEEPVATLSPEQKRCLANKLPGETYQQAIVRSKECLLTLGLPNLALNDPEHPEQSPLGRWSPKYKSILEHIEAIPGSSLVYSQFLGMEGIGIFTIAMQANGYIPIKVIREGGELVLDPATEESLRKGPGANVPRFILFTGGEEEEIRKVNIDIFNAKFGELPPRINQVLAESGFTEAIGNKRGELCRVFCITAAGAEGLSLKNVRGVHIMEPYWNDVRMAQVKGRAVRICSHQDLPLKERNVRIFTYMTVYSEEAQTTRGDPREGERMKWAIPQEIWVRDGINRATAESYGISIRRDDYCLTSDERLFYISERKKKLVENLIVVMKSAAADCLLNYEENKDGTFVCRMLGNEGDFLYHPNLQRDIETSRADVIGDLFKVPEEELARIRAAQARLVFEEEKEGEAEPEAEAAPQQQAVVARQEEEKGAAVAGLPERKPAAPPPPPPQTSSVAAAPPKRISYPVKISGTEYVVSAIPNQRMEVTKFFVFDKADKAFAIAKGEAQAEFKSNRWIPKAGTVILYKK